MVSNRGHGIHDKGTQSYPSIASSLAQPYLKTEDSSETGTAFALWFAQLKSMLPCYDTKHY